jgi:hypothetical protein
VHARAALWMRTGSQRCVACLQAAGRRRLQVAELGRM